MSVDWSKPIEAVNTVDGRVVPVTLGRGPDDEGYYALTDGLEGGGFYAHWFNADGTQQFSLPTGGKPWKIRNRQPETPRVSDEVVDRMVAHLRAMAAFHTKRPVRDERAMKNWDDLQEIVALLPKPVDPDLIEVREVLARYWETEPEGEVVADRYRRGMHDDSSMTIAGMAALKRGRQLAASGK